MKTNIFCYGTLQSQILQKKLFNKTFETKKCTLLNYIKMSDETPYFYIKYTKGRDLEGFIIEVENDDLFFIDKWEDVPYYEKYECEVIDDKNNKIKAYFYNKDPVGESKIADNKNILNDIEIKDLAASLTESYNTNFFDLNYILSCYKYNDNIDLISLFKNMNNVENKFNEQIKKCDLEIKESEGKLSEINIEIIGTKKLKIKFDDMSNEIHSSYLVAKRINNASVNKNFIILYFYFINKNEEPEIMVCDLRESKFEILLDNKWFSKKEFLIHLELKEVTKPLFYICFKEKISDDTRELLFLNRREVLGRVCDKETLSQMHKNLAFYDSAKIFANNNMIIEESKTFSTSWQERLLSEIYTLYILDILICNIIVNEKYSMIVDRFWSLYNLEEKFNWFLLNETLDELKEFERNTGNFLIKIDIDNLFEWKASSVLASNIFSSLGFNKFEILSLKRREEFDKIKLYFNELQFKKDKQKNKRIQMFNSFLMATMTFLLSSSLIIDFLRDILGFDYNSVLIGIFSTFALLLVIWIVSIFYFRIKNKMKDKIDHLEFENFKKDK